MSVSTGVIFGAGTLLSWGIADFFAKIAIGRLGSMHALLIQQIVGLIAITGYTVAVFKGIPIVQLNILLMLIGCASLQALGYIMFYKSLEYGKLSTASPIASSWAAIAVLLSMIVLGERPTNWQLVSVMIILAGVVTTAIVRNKEMPHSGAEGRSGIREALFAMVFWGVSFTFVKVVVDVVGVILPVVFFRAFCIVVLVPLAIDKRSRKLFGFETPFLVLCLCGILDVLGLVFYNAGIESDLASIVAPIASSFPAVAIFLGYVFLRERMTNNQKIGGVLICGGLVSLSLA